MKITRPVAPILVFVLVMLLAPPAHATFRGTSCGTWVHAAGGLDDVRVQGCVMVNEHKFTGALQGLARFNITGGSWAGSIKVEVDYVRLLNGNGNVLRANNADITQTLGGGTFERSTEFYAQGACTSQTKARYRFLHVTASHTHTSGWIVRSSAFFNGC